MPPVRARGTGPLSPRNTTGRIYAENLQKEEAKKAAKEAAIDLEAIRNEAYQAGYKAAYEEAFMAGWNALAEIMVNAGIDVDTIVELDDEGN